MPRVAIIDCEIGNLFSVKNVCEFVGLEANITQDHEDLLLADGVILPGVGAFGDAIGNLERLDFLSPIKDYIASGRPFMGICLGMQLLFTESEEFGQHKGLDVIPGQIVRFPNQRTGSRIVKVPQVCWNRIHPSEDGGQPWDGCPLEDVDPGEYMYFVHSYYCVPDDPSVTLCRTTYGDTIYCSGLVRSNVFATQFHPEKSGSQGVKIYKEWAARLADARRES
jgi:glutamine amidotransferase